MGEPSDTSDSMGRGAEKFPTVQTKENLDNR